MIPMILKIRIPRKQSGFINLYLPLFILWILLFPFFLVFSLIIGLIGFFSWCIGKGNTIIHSLPIIFAILWNLQGLEIDVQDKETQIYFSFQ